MAKKKKEENIPRPTEDLRIEQGKPKFNSVLSAFVKHKPKPKDKDNESPA
jgi:hypothetical protein